MKVMLLYVKNIGLKGIQVKDMENKIKNPKQKLFSITKDDFRIEFYRDSGAGGQNRNKRDTACRITHIETGITTTCCNERSQLQNKRKAFMQLTDKPEFKNWLKTKTAQAIQLIPTKEQIEKEVEEWMKEDNLKIEYF